MGKDYHHAGPSSSSSDSDSEFSFTSPPPRRDRRRCRSRRENVPAAKYGVVGLGTAPTAKEEEKKKKKKKKPPPQQCIDEIWEQFSPKKFSTVLAVLPFSPVPPSSSGERANEMLSAGYERAVEECRGKVRKIITECRRINTRYRDRWDIVSFIVSLEYYSNLQHYTYYARCTTLVNFSTYPPFVVQAHFTHISSTI